MFSKKKLKVLFVHEVSYETKVVFEMHEFPELLSLRGHTVQFVDYPEHKCQGFFESKSPKILDGRAFSQSQILLYSLPNFFRQPFGRIFAFFFSFFYMASIIRKTKPDVIVLYGVPTNGIQTIRAARKLKVPVLHRAIDVSHLLRPGLLSKAVPLTEKYVFKNSNLVLANNDALGRYVASRARLQNHIRVLPPGVKTVDPAKVNNDGQRYDFVFMGTLFRFSGLEWVLRELATNEELTERTLLIIGSGEAEKKLKNLTHELKISKRVTFTGQIEFDNLQSTVSQGRVALLPFDESQVARLALPGKVFQYLNFGLITVSTRLDGLKSVLPDEYGVIYNEPGRNFMLLANELCKNPERVSSILSKGQNHLAEIGNWNNVIEEFEEILYDLRFNRCQ